MEKEKEKKKVNWSKVLAWAGWGLNLALGIIALKQKERADKLEGENINLRRSLRGAQRTINIQNYNLGKKSNE